MTEDAVGDGGTDDRFTPLTDATLRAWPLPLPDEDGDKEERGRVLVIGGCDQMPGAVVLAATAALRAGAGKVTVATSQSVATAVGVAVPEALVIGLAQGPHGGLRLRHPAELDAVLCKTACVLVGPGMQDEGSSCALAREVLARSTVPVLLDAAAMGAALDARSPAPRLLTPHAGEMAHLDGADKQALRDGPGHAARSAAARWQAVVTLKGATTVIAAPDGQAWQHEGGNPGLGISGSGDVLAGLIAGLAARGASLTQAAAWGVVLHARAGDRLRERHGPLGFLARELADEVPGLMHAIANAG